VSARAKTHTLAETAEQVLERRAASLAIETIEDEVSDQLSLLLFRIADEWYAVPVSAVREIFQEYEVTPIPCVPDFILGVVNVRGEILSVTDPAQLMHLGLVEPEAGVLPPVVVVTDEEVATALVVDEIGDITEVANGSVEPPVSIIDRAQAEFIAGSVFVDGAMVGLLNVERVLEPIGSAGRY
jgi:purine-binding chemotaxis protein CheW